jgi:LPS sulfotransferase NodH
MSDQAGNGPRRATGEVADFARVTAGLTPNPDTYARLLAVTQPPRCRYAILFAPRSGSTWLSFLALRTGVLGQPFEFLNPAEIPVEVRRVGTADQARYLDAVMRRAQSSNRVFGIKLRAIDVALFGEDAFFRDFLPARFAVLHRQDLLAQGVSLYRAVASGRWHSYDAVREPPAYDADAIAHWTAQAAEVERDNEALIQRRDLAPLRLCYETMVQYPAGALAVLARLAGVTPPPVQASTSNGLSLLADDWNESVAARFRRERSAFLDTLFAARPPACAGTGGAVGEAGGDPRGSPEHLEKDSRRL